MPLQGLALVGVVVAVVVAVCVVVAALGLLIDRDVAQDERGEGR